MNIFLKDNAGLGKLLMMEGFSEDQINEVKQRIRTLFRSTAEFVFLKMLEKELPETLEITMEQNSEDDEISPLAMFLQERSNDNHLRFAIYENSLREAMSDEPSTELGAIVLHEMLHAVDMPTLKKNHELLELVERELNNNFHDTQLPKEMSLFSVLLMLNHYRAEGVAIMGEHLLEQKPLYPESLPEMRIRLFLIFARTIGLATQWLNFNEVEIFDNVTRGTAYYGVAPVALLDVLEVCNLIEKNAATKIWQGFETGQYELSDEEKYAIIRSALSMSLTEYTKGLLATKYLEPALKPFLEFCGDYQQECDYGNIEQFSKLVGDKISTETYRTTMENIMGCVIPVVELEQYCKNLYESTAEDSVKDKVRRLFSILKTDNSKKKRDMAQWALTYFFDNEDLIHDDIQGLGLVDDMLVIDKTINLLDSK